MIDSITKLFSSVFGNQAAGGKVFHASLKCAECGSKLWAEADAAEPVWVCPNPDCPAELRAGIAHWCSPGAMDIAGGEKLTAQLVGSGLVMTVAELYRLKARELTRIKGLDTAAAQKFLEAIVASKKRDLWRVLYGLRIPGVSADAAQALGREFPTLPHVLGASAKQLMVAEKVSEAVAQSIIHWTGDRQNRDVIKRLDKLGVNFKSELYRPVEKEAQLRAE